MLEGTRPRRRLPHVPALVVSVGGVVAVTLLLLAIRGAPYEEVHFLPYLVPVGAAAWIGGLRYGLLATALALLACPYFVMAPPMAWPDRVDVVLVSVFVLVAAWLSGLSELARRKLEELGVERERLSRSETFHAAISELAADFAFDARVDAQQRVHVEGVTEGFARLTGFHAAEVSGPGGWLEIVDPEDRALALEQRRQVLAGERVGGRLRLRRRDGRPLIVEHVTRARRDGGGRVVRIYGAARDVTAQAEAERARLEAERRLDLAQSAAGVGTWELDVASGAVSWSPGIWRLIGREVGEFEPSVDRWHEHLIAEDAAAAWAGFRSALEDRGVAEFAHDFRVRRADGALRWLHSRARIERDAGGRAVRVHGINFDVTERRASEVELRRSHAFFEAIAALSSDYQFESRLDAQGRSRTEYVSLGFTKLLGYSLEELDAAGGTAALVDPRDEAAAAAARTQLLAGEIAEGEMRLVAKGGEPVWIRFRTRPIRETDGSVRFVGAARDIRERKLAEQALERYERRFRALFRLEGYFAALLDPTGRIESANDNLLAIGGIDLAHAQGLLLWDAPWWQGRDAPQRRLSDAVRQAASGRSVSLGRVPVAAGGVTRCGDFVLAPIFDDEGRVENLVLEGRDVSAEVDAQLAIEALNASLIDQVSQLRSIMDTAPLAIWIAHDAEGRRVSGNAYGNALLGLDPNADVGVAPEVERFRRGGVACPRSELPLRRCLATGQPVLNDELELVMPDGRSAWLLCNAAPIRDERGRVCGAVVACLDISELRRAMETVRAADRRKDEFLATLGHELRNPLAPIRTTLQILRYPGLDEPRKLRTLEAAERQVDHLVRLVDDLMDVARVTTGKINLRRERIALRAVVDSAVEIARPLLDRARHELTVSLPDAPVMLNGDPVRLAQVLANLLNNAAKYTDEGGSIRIEARTEAGEAVISVIDDGVGIPPETIPRLFEMFTQLDRSKRKAQGGLGVGLSLVKTLVEMHGGRVEAHSDGLGRGSCFRIRLPLAAADDVTRPPPRSVASGGAIGGVLIVDDNREAADSLATALTLLGCTACASYDAHEALRLLDDRAFDAALIDIGMPGMDGLELARALRSAPRTRSLRLVALSGFGMAPDRTRSLAAGFDAHLVKPASVEDVLAAIRDDRSERVEVA